MSTITPQGARWRAAWRSFVWCYAGFVLVLGLPLALAAVSGGGGTGQVMGALFVAMIGAAIITGVVGPIVAGVALSCDWSDDAREQCDLCGADLHHQCRGDRCPTCGSICPESGQDVYAAHRMT